MTKEAPTISAVLKHADQLRQQADRIMAADCYAKPYYPTSAAAKRLAQMCTKARLDQLDVDATDDLRDTEAAKGPADAIAILTDRSLRAAAAYREEKITADHTAARHRKRQVQAVRDREAQLDNLTVGRRIDRALARLATIGSVKAQALDADKVRGTSEHCTPKYPGDPAAKARAIAHRAMREIENELDDASRRRVELEAA